MADPTANDDQNLLERLNALKATNVTLDRSSNALDVPSAGIEPAADPPSREDALSARLRTLRNRPSAPATPSPPPPPAARDREDPPPPYTEGNSAALPPRHSPGHGGRASSSVLDPTASSHSPPPASSHLQGGSAGGGGGVDDLDELLGTGASQSLDDILEGLDDLDDDQWPSVPKDTGGPDEEARVAELLAKLRDDPPFQVIKADSREGKKDVKDDDEAADDSEGEVMKREIDNVIAKALDEVHLDETMPPEEKFEGDSTMGADRERKTNPEFSLPSAPSNLRDSSDEGISTEEETSTDNDTSEDEDSEGDSRKGAARRKQKGQKKKKAKLKLPDAPVRIWDPAVTTETNFETDIARRMAFLKRLNGPLEMPSVPTFKPEDKARKGPP